MMQALTPRQKMVLDFINQSISDRGYPPTLREIAAHLGIRTTNGVNDHLRALERKGYLKREEPRSHLVSFRESSLFKGKRRVWKNFPPSYDVFLCYNADDRKEIREIAKRLEGVGMVPWFDEWHLRPGISWQDELENQIESITSAAVFIGTSGIGPWQEQEIKALIREFVSRKCPVIPVLLETCSSKPKLPIFLKGIQWVDFHESEPEPFSQLLWGITGKKSRD